MSTDRARRTPSGRTLRLVTGAADPAPGADAGTESATGPVEGAADAPGAGDERSASGAGTGGRPERAERPRPRLRSADAPWPPPQADEPPGGPAGASVTGPDDDTLVLPGQRRSVAVGRHWVVRCVVAHGVTGMANQVIELLTSEGLANAVLHGPETGAIGIGVRVDGDGVRVSVSDAGGAPPVVVHNAPNAPAGRGMAIVEAMSTRWGVDEHGDGSKTVWFELDLEDF